MTFSAAFSSGNSMKTVKAVDDVPITAKKVYGDLNNDGTINIFDLMFLKKILLIGDINNKMLKYADVDGDGQTTFKDISEMAKYLMKVIGIFEPELELDADEDGLFDYLEQLLGTDMQKSDTDLDGLSDYEEVYITFTDPLKSDTNQTGVSDTDADNDNDGLSNRDEIKNNTNPNTNDTDNDKLNDSDELKLGTDPLKADSDNDNISDYGELQLGVNPIIQSTDGLSSDNKRYFEQLMDDENLSKINTFDNCYSLKVSANMAGYIGEELNLDDSKYSAFLSNNSIYGRIIDVNYFRDYENLFDTSKFSYTLDFCLCEELDPNDYMIFYYAEEDCILVPFETSITENVLSVSYNKPATFCLVNISDSSDTFDNEIIDTSITDSNEEIIGGTTPDGTTNQITTFPPQLANISYYFEVSNFKIDGWDTNPELRESIIDSAAQLSSDGIQLNINMIFYGSAYVSAGGHGYYKVTINCKSSADIGDVFLRADEFFQNDVKDASDAANVYNKVISHSDRESAYNLEYSLYYSLAPNIKEADSLSFYVGKGYALYNMRIGYMNIKVNSPDIDDFKACLYSNLEPSEKIYTLAKHNKNMIYSKSPFLGFVYSKPTYVKYITDYYNNKGIDSSLSGKISNRFTDVPTVGYVTSKQNQTTKGTSQYANKTGVNLRTIEECLYIPWTGNPGTDDSDGDGIEDFKDANPRCPFDFRFYVAPTMQPVTSNQTAMTNLLKESKETYNIVEVTKADVSTLKTASTLCVGGFMGQMTVASQHLNHYMFGNGKTLSDEPFSYVLNTIRGPLIIGDNLNLVRDICEDTVVDSLCFNSKEDTNIVMSDLTSKANIQSEIDNYIDKKNSLAANFMAYAKSMDYYFGIGSCGGTMNFKCYRENDKYIATVYMYMLDFYDFEDSDNQVFFIDDVLTDRDMYKLHRCGFANEYLYVGKLCFKMEWKQGERINKDLEGITQVQSYLVKQMLVS